jgi:hypothetical protein
MQAPFLNCDIKKIPNMGVFGIEWGLSWGYIILIKIWGIILMFSLRHDNSIAQRFCTLQ